VQPALPVSARPQRQAQGLRQVRHLARWNRTIAERWR
jgi:hypothetical protein